MLILWLYGLDLKKLSIWIKIVQENAKCELCFWIFNSKFELNTLLVFSFTNTFSDEY